jgi:hypothetical protein
MTRQQLLSLRPAFLVLALGALAVHGLLVWAVLDVVASGKAIGDWTSFYAAGTMVRTGLGEQLFDIDAQTAMQQALFGPDAATNQFPLPGFFAIALSPFTRLSFTQTYWLWLGLNIGVLAVLAAAMWSQIRSQRFILVGLAVTSLPVIDLLLLGQVDLVVLLGVVLCFGLLRAGNHSLAGLVLTLALLKPHLAAAIVLFLIIKHQWRVLRSFALASVGLLALSPFLFGPATIVDQARLLVGAVDTAAVGQVNAHMMANMRGFIVSILGSDSQLVWIPVTLLIAVWAVRACVTEWRGVPVLSTRSWALACLLPLLWSPHLHAHSLVFLVAAYAFLLSQQPEEDALYTILAVIGYCVLTALWLVSLAGVALLGFVVIGAFIFTLRTPSSVRVMPQAAAPKATRQTYIQPERRAS